jgi:hypothetical protein
VHRGCSTPGPEPAVSLLRPSGRPGVEGPAGGRPCASARHRCGGCRSQTLASRAQPSVVGDNRDPARATMVARPVGRFVLNASEVCRSSSPAWSRMNETRRQKPRRRCASRACDVPRSAVICRAMSHLSNASWRSFALPCDRTSCSSASMGCRRGAARERRGRALPVCHGCYPAAGAGTIRCRSTGRFFHTIRDLQWPAERKPPWTFEDE